MICYSISVCIEMRSDTIEMNYNHKNMSNDE